MHQVNKQDNKQININDNDNKIIKDVYLGCGTTIIIVGDKK